MSVQTQTYSYGQWNPSSTPPQVHAGARSLAGNARCLLDLPGKVNPDSYGKWPVHVYIYILFTVYIWFTYWVVIFHSKLLNCRYLSRCPVRDDDSSFQGSQTTDQLEQPRLCLLFLCGGSLFRGPDPCDAIKGVLPKVLATLFTWSFVWTRK